ncbi:protein of unknown function [Magnetospira sp. QH-2]|nr:protein of unknown function [Magnetospira sp. QH-2]
MDLKLAYSNIRKYEYAMGLASRSHLRAANKEKNMSAFIWYVAFYVIIGLAGFMLYKALRNVLCVNKMIEGCK